VDDGPPDGWTRWLGVATAAVGGLVCVGFVVLVADEEAAAPGVLLFPLAAAGVLLLALAGWGVWTRDSAGGASCDGRPD
jgi:hypothetical protein